MSLQLTIEVAAPSGMDTTSRGRLLSAFAKEFLESQNFRVEEEVRLTGNEVDLLSVEKQTSERHFVECKAHRGPIAAEVLTKIFGNVGMKGFHAGWLISTSSLSKDAKGLWDEWQAQPPEQRRKLQIYYSSGLAERLISSRLVCNPDNLPRQDEQRYANEACLLVTPQGVFWALTILDKETGIRQAVDVFEAREGVRVTARQLLSTLGQTDSSLSSLEWQVNAASDVRRQSDRLRSELQSVVRVPIADHWADYRPARPEDFVGRDELQDELFMMLERARQAETETRLFALKGPSGWGKSSFVLKVAARAKNKRNKNKFFVYPVDSRAAISDRYGELALYTAFKEAMRAGFIPEVETFEFGGVDSPFSSLSMTETLEYLRRASKLICLVFDQFEELLFKNDLEPVFDKLRSLCDAVDEAQAGVVIGFSWKTDGTIAPEHKAYHLWHSLADRRLEFELRPFTDNEVAAALNRFSKELGQPLAPQLRRLLQDHSQGYPWLLKKLCIHILDLIKNGLDQSDILVRSLSIQDLFKRDVEGLTQSEFNCVKQICKEAPAEFYSIVNMFGSEVVQSLIEKRLVIRSGPRLNVYWDIFRDYILNERVPYIPINYVPQVNLRAYIMGVKLVLERRTVTYDDLAKHLDIAEGTADNLVRDLVMIGHAEANRKGRIVSALHGDADEAQSTLLEFCSSHALYRGMVSEFGMDRRISDDEVRRIAGAVLKAATISEKLMDHHRQKMMRWFISAGLVERHGREYSLRSRPRKIEMFAGGGDRFERRGLHLFIGEAPPETTLEAFCSLVTKGNSREQIEAECGRNTLSAMMNLGLIGADCGVLVDTSSFGYVDSFRQAVSACPTVLFVREFLDENAVANGEEIGEAVATRFGMDWSQGSRRRAGNSLKRWSTWLQHGEAVDSRRKKKSADQMMFDV